MLEADPIQLAGLVFGAIAVSGVTFTLMWPYLSGEKTAEKRLAGVTEAKAKRPVRTAQQEQISNRKQQVADTIKELETRQKQKEKLSLRVRIQRAGLDVSPNAFWIASGLCGLAVDCG